VSRYPIKRFALVCACLIVALANVGSTVAGFTSQASNPANSFSSAPDYRAPTVQSSAIAKAAGGEVGYIHQGGGYRVYANVTDTGNPASGVASVTADASNVTAGQTAVALTAGSFTVGSNTYGYRSGALTAGTPLAAGTTAYSVSTADVAGNIASPANLSVVVDNTAPAGSDIQTQNNGSIVRRPEPGDTVTFTYNDTIDPFSILSTWGGSSTAVVVRIINGALFGNDTLQVYDAANTTQLPLGTVNLGGANYVGGLFGGEIGTFGATGTASTMVQSGAAITITLGTAGGQAATTNGGNSSMAWTPSATATDRAGNASSTTATNEGGAADGEF
jgi:hypothetical protein